ncbi:hypothetical protein [Bacillus niameyensis]|uniref:hypothetical protein n=1 Tax=Bacillus niameyensis TaxID=1522308 RepID=UPI0007808F44|nr:hypothetical protein [Bacillus niameyensis]
MNILMGLLPLILLIAIPIIFLSKRKAGSFGNKKVVKTLLILYAAILILSVFIFELLPLKEEGIPRVRDERKTHELEQAIFDGRLEVVDPMMIRDEWKKDYQGKKLTITVDSNGDYYFPIIVERKPENDGVIEGKFIVSFQYNGLDFTERINPVEVVLNGDRLHVMGAGTYVSIKAATYQKEFVLSQFSEKRGSMFENDHFHIRSLYLRIPQDVEIEGNDDLFLNYTGEVTVEE